MAMSVLRIIPHRNARNNETRRLYSALHDLFTPSSTNAITRLAKRLHGANTEPQSLWWIVRMTADESGSKIEYYTAMHDAYVDAYKTKFRGHEGWKSCTLEPVDQFNDAIDIERSNLYKLHYKRHNMFSLEFDYREESMPIQSVMSVIREMKSGESVTLYIRMESVDRMKWKRAADYAWEQWKKGEMIYRAGFDPVRLTRNVFHLGQIAFNGAHNLVTDALGAVQRQFMNPQNGDFQHREPLKKTNHDRDELLVNGDLSNRTKQKRNLPVFKTSIRFTVTSADHVRREMLARSLTNAYESTDKQVRWQDNILVASRIKLNAKKEIAALAEWRITELDPMMISTDEMGKLCQLPIPELQDEFKDYLESNQRTEVEIPKVFLDDSGILVGTATDRGVTHNVHIPVDNKDRLFTPRVINGSPRMGKDMWAVNFVVEAKRKHNIGAVIPDFIDERGKDAKGNWRGMANAIRDHLSPDDVIDVDLSNTAYSFFLGLQMIFRNVKDTRIAADLISEYLCDFLMADGDEDKFQTQEYAREAAKATMGDMIGMKQMFTNSEYRQMKIEEWQDVLDMDLWEDFNRMSDKDGGMSGKQGMIAGPVLRRIGQLTGREYLKTMFCQSNPNKKGDLFQWIKDGKVVIIRVRMPDGIAMPEPVKQILAYWIYLLTFLIKLTLGGQGSGTYIVLNEPAQYLSSGLVHFMERTLAEGPKYRITPIIIFHDFSQFKKFPGFVDMLLASSVNWHLFKNTNEKVYDRLMPYLSKTFAKPQDAFEATKAFQYIAVWLNNNAEYEPPFVCDALPMVGDRYETQNNEHLTAEHIRKYGRPTKEVLEENRKRNKMSFQKA